MRYLLDTNVPSELTRTQPDARVAAFLLGVAREDLFLSAMTMGEIRKGIELSAVSNKRAMLQRWFEVDLVPWFQDRILPIDQTVAERWGVLTAEARKRGIAVSVVDGLIAATALEAGLTLATRNVRDFASLGVSVVNPWE